MQNEGPTLVRSNGNVVSEAEMLELILTTEKSIPKPVALFNVRLDYSNPFKKLHEAISFLKIALHYSFFSGYCRMMMKLKRKHANPPKTDFN